MPYYKPVIIALLSAQVVNAFSPGSHAFTQSPLTKLSATVDREVITKKEYEDIAGASFEELSEAQRADKTKYLYPKHVEVVEDLAPMVNEMVDKVVRILSLYKYVVKSKKNLMSL